MRGVAAEHGLEQHVRSPTRECHLLDLCLCDLSEVKCNVLPKIADHSVVETMLALPIQETAQSLRKVWLMGAGDWLRLSDTLADHDWSALSATDLDEWAEMLTATILKYARECIPEKMISVSKAKHPWLNSKVLHLVREKIAKQGTAEEATAITACSVGVREEYQAWVVSARKEIAELPRGSKQWWSKTNELLAKAQKACSINALKNQSGSWVRDAAGKADLFASTFSSKFQMPDAEDNAHSEIESRGTSMNAVGVVVLREA